MALKIEAGKGRSAHMSRCGHKEERFQHKAQKCCQAGWPKSGGCRVKWWAKMEDEVPNVHREGKLSQALRERARLTSWAIQLGFTFQVFRQSRLGRGRRPSRRLVEPVSPEGLTACGDVEGEAEGQHGDGRRIAEGSKDGGQHGSGPGGCHERAVACDGRGVDKRKESLGEERGARVRCKTIRAKQTSGPTHGEAMSEGRGRGRMGGGGASWRVLPRHPCLATIHPHSCPTATHHLDDVGCARLGVPCGSRDKQVKGPAHAEGRLGQLVRGEESEGVAGVLYERGDRRVGAQGFDQARRGTRTCEQEAKGGCMGQAEGYTSRR